MNIKLLESELLKLPPQKRAAIAYRLMESLDKEEDGDIETIWIEEAERRYQSIEKRKSNLKIADDVMREAKSKYK